VELSCYHCFCAGDEGLDFTRLKCHDYTCIDQNTRLYSFCQGEGDGPSSYWSTCTSLRIKQSSPTIMPHKESIDNQFTVTRKIGTPI